MNPLIIFPAYCLIGIIVLPIYWTIIEMLIDSGKIEEGSLPDKIKDILLTLYLISLVITLITSVVMSIIEDAMN